MSEKFRYNLTTHKITISVHVYHAAELSEPKQHKYIYIYKVSIINNNSNPVKLLRRSWRIVEEGGIGYEVTGEGVIGQQPTILPGTSFEYASQALLYNKTGMMFGNYEFINLKLAREFIVAIPAFSLDIEPIKAINN